MKIRILVAYHKPYRMPTDNVYLPFDVRTATLDHRHWCELSAIYDAWAGKVAADAETIGLVHYRRHFRGRGSAEATQDEFAAKLGGADVILPKKRNYWIETNYSQYVHAHPSEGLDKTREIVAERHSDYLVDFDRVMKKTCGHRFNMFVMRRKRLDEYCAWLFGILFELEKRIDVSGYSSYDARVFGFVSERLLDVWVDHEIRTSGLRVAEMRVLNLESQHWPRKIFSFLLRKFAGRGK